MWSLAWHPLGHILCSGSNDHTTKFWCRNRPGDDMNDKYNNPYASADGLGMTSPLLRLPSPHLFPSPSPPSSCLPLALPPFIYSFYSVQIWLMSNKRLPRTSRSPRCQGSPCSPPHPRCLSRHHGSHNQWQCQTNLGRPSTNRGRRGWEGDREGEEGRMGGPPLGPVCSLTPLSSFLFFFFFLFSSLLYLIININSPTEDLNKDGPCLTTKWCPHSHKARPRANSTREEEGDTEEVQSYSSFLFYFFFILFY